MTDEKKTIDYGEDLELVTTFRFKRKSQVSEDTLHDHNRIKFYAKIDGSMYSLNAGVSFETWQDLGAIMGLDREEEIMRIVEKEFKANLFLAIQEHYEKKRNGS